MLGRESFALLYYPCIIRALSVHYPCIIHALSMHYPYSFRFLDLLDFRTVPCALRHPPRIFFSFPPAFSGSHFGPPEFHAFLSLGLHLSFGVGGMRRNSAKCDDQKSMSPFGSAE